MGISEIFYIIDPVMAAVFVGGAFAVIGMEPNDFRLARGLFWAGAICMVGLPMVWNLTAERPLAIRWLVLASVGATVAVSLSEALRYTARRQHWVSENHRNVKADTFGTTSLDHFRLQGSSDRAIAAQRASSGAPAPPPGSAISKAPPPIGKATIVSGRTYTPPRTTRSVAALSPQPVTPPVLKRLIAYDVPTVDVNDLFVGDQVQWFFQVATLRSENVSGDTITIRVNKMNVYYNDMSHPIVSTHGDGDAIVAQTRGELFQARAADKTIPFPNSVVNVIVDFELQYDTIPKTGVRLSGRKISYAVDWANGPKGFPLFVPTVLEQYEK